MVDLNPQSEIGHDMKPSNRLSHLSWADRAKDLAKDHGKSIPFVEDLAARLLDVDPQMRLIVQIETDGESDRPILTLIVDQTSLPFERAEQLLNEASENTYDVIGYPGMAFVASMK